MLAYLPDVEKRDKLAYENAVKQSSYLDYIQSADYHYFISRVLFLHKITDYSLFSGHQCVENYLKAYLKYCEEQPHNTHNLKELLKKCRENTSLKTSFINTDKIDYIIRRYEPFFELARYPVHKNRPKGGHGWVYPNDIYTLDYFVYKMRKTMAIPEGTRDIFSQEGHFSLIICKEEFPDFYEFFKMNNINFQGNESSED